MTLTFVDAVLTTTLMIYLIMIAGFGQRTALKCRRWKPVKKRRDINLKGFVIRPANAIEGKVIEIVTGNVKDKNGLRHYH